MDLIMRAKNDAQPTCTSTASSTTAFNISTYPQELTRLQLSVNPLYPQILCNQQRAHTPHEYASDTSASRATDPSYSWRTAGSPDNHHYLGGCTQHRCNFLLRSPEAHKYVAIIDATLTVSRDWLQLSVVQSAHTRQNAMDCPPSARRLEDNPRPRVSSKCSRGRGGTAAGALTSHIGGSPTWFDSRWVQSLVSVRGNRAGRCRWSAGFSRRSPVSHTLAIWHCRLIVSRDLFVKGRPYFSNLHFTRSSPECRLTLEWTGELFHEKEREKTGHYREVSGENVQIFAAERVMPEGEGKPQRGARNAGYPPAPLFTAENSPVNKGPGTSRDANWCVQTLRRAPLSNKNTARVKKKKFPAKLRVECMAIAQSGRDGNPSWESCRTIPLVGGFSRGSPVYPAPSFRRRSILTSIILIGSRNLAFCPPASLARSRRFFTPRVSPREVRTLTRAFFQSAEGERRTSRETLIAVARGGIPLLIATRFLLYNSNLNFTCSFARSHGTGRKRCRPSMRHRRNLERSVHKSVRIIWSKLLNFLKREGIEVVFMEESRTDEWIECTTYSAS
ncbi:hypothetical protein PR048_031720 [Dryococelus australis]|uniref:Uncharacterized protein n=1 Tax=Dryococelus australis TaxID=614101 RepID=A0ABQ9G8V3_9NEOP|nr:hypothetical protein PR048_031720 [Dryococelus australis]